MRTIVLVERLRPSGVRRYLIPVHRIRAVRLHMEDPSDPFTVVFLDDISVSFSVSGDHTERLHEAMQACD